MNKTPRSSKTVASLCLLAFAATFAHAASATQYTAHASLAADLIAHVAPANNVYDSDPTIVSWAGVNGAAIYQNRSTCSPFVTRVLKTAYGATEPAKFSDAAFKVWFGSSSPSSAQYYSAIVSQKGFTRILKPIDIQGNDIITFSYLPCANKSTTGHTMIAMSTATQRSVDTQPIIPGTVQYEVQVADSSNSEHAATDSNGTVYPDTRTVGNGAGIGMLRLYKSIATDEIVGYTWSMSSGSDYYSVDSCRTIAVGRIQ